MTINELYAVIKSRLDSGDNDSYVVSLIKDKDKMIQKVGEEATEFVIAAKNRSRERLIEETADLWFHTLVVLTEKGITINEIYNEFGIRHKEKEIAKLKKR